MPLDQTRAAARIDDARDVLAAMWQPYRNVSHARGGFLPIGWNRRNVPVDGVPEATDGSVAAFTEHTYYRERVDGVLRPARGPTWAQVRAALADTPALQLALRRLHRNTRCCLQTYGPNDAARPFHPSSAGLLFIMQIREALPGTTVYQAQRGWGIASGETHGFEPLPEPRLP